MDDDDDVICEKCGTEMIYIGTEVYHEGQHVSVSGCPKCQHQQVGKR